MSQRRGPTKKTRFEVFKRDSFTCQYCGKSAPEVVLECDHVKPFAKGGASAMTNYVTACHDCNAGKGVRELSDDSVLGKQKRQLDLLQSRREQIAMMAQWQSGLVDLEREQARAISDLYGKIMPGKMLNEHGLELVGGWLRKYGFMDVADSLRDVVANVRSGHIPTINNDEDDVRRAIWAAWPKYCAMKDTDRKKPWLKKALYIRGVLKNRFGDREWAQRDWLDKLSRALEAGADYDALYKMAANSRNISTWEEAIDKVLWGLSQ